MCNSDSTPATRQCSIDSCAKDVLCKGLCASHYQRLRKYGDPLGRAEPKRVEKFCGWCGRPMSLKPAEAKKRIACSRSCANKMRNGAGSTKTFACRWCREAVAKRVRKGDKGVYCSRECSDRSRAHVASERAGIRRIAKNIQRKNTRKDGRIAIEVAAIKRIYRRAKNKQAECNHCARPFFRRMKWQRFCSHSCRDERKADSRERYRRSPLYRAARSRGKALRRSRMTMGQLESIDPIKVFEEDGWKCYICGVDTPQRKRGTYCDDAPELDHIHPISAGGAHVRRNVACCCRACNISKGDAILYGRA